MNRLVGAAAAVVAMLELSAAPATAATTASLTSAIGTPGAVVTVSGAGFDPGASVDVFFDTTDIAFASSNASGAVTMTIAIPTSAQPGTHWITLDELSTHASAQAQFSVVESWPQAGWGPSGRGYNPFENTINPANAAQLTDAWSQVVTPYGNPKPFVYNNGEYVFDENETLHAYSPTGKLLFTAVPGTTFRFAQAAPVAYGSYIYLGDANGLVTAYNYHCRTDGGVCATQLWHVNIGTPVEGGLTQRGSWIYAPGGDGLVHLLNTSTGAAGTTITPDYSGAITQPVTFGEDGTAYIVQTNSVSEIGPGVGGGEALASGTSFSAVAVGNGEGYATSTDGNLDKVPGGWSTAIGSTGCDVAPAYANDVVYAAGCNSIGAYDPETGAARWSVAQSTAPQGLAIANGVLYVCDGYRLYTYDAGYGGKLGGGGLCGSAPEIVQGTVYLSASRLTAASLNGATTTSVHGVRIRRPDPRRLRRSLRLHRRGAPASRDGRHAGSGRRQHAA